jgi:hypothetical protein
MTSPREAAACLQWHGEDAPGAWVSIEREFRDGHREPWWATDLTFGGRGPDKDRRLIVLTSDPASLPELTDELGLFDDYRIRRPPLLQKALPAREGAYPLVRNAQESAVREIRTLRLNGRGLETGSRADS